MSNGTQTLAITTAILTPSAAVVLAIVMTLVV
jgi:hypothetical protein